jgi:4-amino-4-deoxy-L-arabinose transferase-like glycosyltransferase
MADYFPASVHRHPLAVLLLICVIAWLPGFFTLPPLDRDESRFAQATKQMLETRDFIDIRLGGVARYEKPAGIYWLQAASTAALGGGLRDEIWSYRVPSLLGALGAVAATFWLVRSIAGTEAGFFAGLILGISALLMSEAKIAKTDAVLLATIVVAQAVIMRAYLSARLPEKFAPPSLTLTLLGWAAFGFGVLVKGPVIAAVSLATTAGLILWDRDWRWLARLRAGWGILVALAIVLPWALAIGIASHGAFFEKSLGQDFAAKLAGGQETHGAPPGYFTALVNLTFWPGSLLLLPGIVYAFRQRREPALRFLLGWATTTWLIFEFAPTKLPHYVLPAYPALAALCGIWLASGAKSKGERMAGYISLGLFVLVGLAIAGALAWAPQRFGAGAPWWVYVAAGLGGLSVVAVIPAMMAHRFAAAFGVATVSAIILYQVAGFLIVPRLTALWLSPRLAQAIARHAEPRDPPVVTAGYAEPSIAFLLGTDTVLEDGLKAGAVIARSGGLALVTEDQRGGFLQALGQGNARAEALEQIDGLNYSRGRETRITLYRVVPQAK